MTDLELIAIALLGLVAVWGDWRESCDRQQEDRD